jgi:GNAT superfamily N-acetyltransferase
LLAPEILSEKHEIEPFSCGKPVLDQWLKKRARANQVSGASRTYVIAEGVRVIGYYCLSSGAIATTDAPGSLSRNMPDPIPMAILGRLAIDQSFQGRGVGTAMLQDAVLRTAQAANIMGIRGLLVHALDESARSFYEQRGFVGSKTSPMTLVLPLKGLAS